MIRRRDIEFINDAIKLAEDNKILHSYTMVSMLCRNKSILSVGMNSYQKTHPNQPQIREQILKTHAEVKAISRYIVKRRKITKDMTLYIAGITKSKVTNCCISSHPCASCMQFIMAQGINRLVYATNTESGFIIHEKILNERC